MSHHHHTHDAGPPGTRNRNLLISILLNFGITLAEVVGGLLSNSLALLSDALHNLGDTFAIFIAYVASRISKKDYNQKKTFGYKRIEILAALFNAIILAVIIVYLFIEAFHRLRHPEPIRGLVMLVVAVTGLAANLVSVLLLHRHSKESINIRSAYVHLIGDTVSSVFVIVTALLVHFFEIYWVDPVVTFLLGLYLLKETYGILRESVDILMQSTPAGLDLIEVRQVMESIPGIDNIHHVHVWNLNDQEIHFECHVDLTEDLKVSETESMGETIRSVLLNKFGIVHVTVQYGHNCCDDKSMIQHG